MKRSAGNRTAWEQEFTVPDAPILFDDPNPFTYFASASAPPAPEPEPSPDTKRPQPASRAGGGYVNPKTGTPQPIFRAPKPAPVVNTQYFTAKDYEELRKNEIALMKYHPAEGSPAELAAAPEMGCAIFNARTLRRQHQTEY